MADIGTGLQGAHAATRGLPRLSPSGKSTFRALPKRDQQRQPR